jgi:hypothetical protein
LVSSRICKQLKDDGAQCKAPPLHDSNFCFWHDPGSEQDREQARRLGGVNRKRENTLATVYETAGIDSIEEIQRFVEVALYGTLALDNGIQRNRTLINGAMAAAKLLEVGELAARVEALEAVLGPKLPQKRQQDKRGRWSR